MLSVIIPSRVDTYLQKTIDDILLKAEGEIEIIIVLDGYWPDPALKPDPRVIVLHQGVFHDSFGMRPAINVGMSIAKGNFVMKCDEHVMFDKGFDIKLQEECDEHTVVIPRRYRLDAEAWTLVEDGRGPVDYMSMDYPYAKPFDKTQGLHGAEDKQRASDRKDILIDDVQTMQGSCYFMAKKHWETTIVEMDTENYGPFTQEAQEISNKTWLSGGRVIVNKKTWYAHFHKGRTGKGYGFSTEQYKRHCEWNEKGRLFCIDNWLNTKEYKHDFKWLIEKFWPIRTWPDDWEARVLVDKDKDYSTLGYKDDFWLSNLAK
jgi:glycosyltransferase involved in cell wall biosynthesis